MFFNLFKKNKNVELSSVENTEVLDSTEEVYEDYEEVLDEYSNGLIYRGEEKTSLDDVLKNAQRRHDAQETRPNKKTDTDDELVLVKEPKTPKKEENQR